MSAGVIVGVRLLEWTRNTTLGVAPDIARFVLFRGVLTFSVGESSRFVPLHASAGFGCQVTVDTTSSSCSAAACAPHAVRTAAPKRSMRRQRGRSCHDGQPPANRTAMSRWVNKTPAQEKRRGRSGVRHIGGMWAAHTREAETAFNGWDGRRLPIPDSRRRWRHERRSSIAATRHVALPLDTVRRTTASVTGSPIRAYHMNRPLVADDGRRGVTRLAP